MAYKAIYRRFRPKSFEDLVGQEHISTILKNQINTDNIAHAYLFSGIRGTGKTSAAKIFARAVNCLSPIEGNPCNKCEVCIASLEENLMDIVEMDAASNNKVEDVRDLRESINYPPSKGRYKVYIVDEIHMFSTAAFNAFLKTLEEPPSYVIFILATTEQQKIPATIISRCQRYEFKRISSEDIAKNMKKICDEVGVEIDEKSLMLIARNSEGAMRDALSILDQVIASSGGRVDYENLVEMLGSVNNKVIVELAESAIDRDSVSLLNRMEDIIKSGKDVTRLIKDLIYHFRNLMLIKSGADYREILDEPEELLLELSAQAEKLSTDRIIDYIDILNQSESDLKYSTQPQITAELALFKLLESGEKEQLIERIEKLESIIESGRFKAAEEKSEPRVDYSNKSGKKLHIVEKEFSKTEDAKDKEPEENPASEKEAEYSSKDISFNDIIDEWAEVLKFIKKKKIALHALLSEGKAVKFKNGILTVEFADQFGFHKDAIDKENNKQAVEELLSNYFQSPVKVNFTMEYEKEKESSDDLVEDVVKLFGSEKLKIED